MLFLVSLYVGYGAVCILSYRRLGWWGVAGLAVVLALGSVLAGHWDYSQPHTHLVPKGNHWACDSLGYVPPASVATVAAALGLIAAGWRAQATWKRQAVVVGLCFLAAFPVLIIVSLYFAIQVWGCDAL